MSLVHVIASQKGGVGKTTTTMNLAAVINEVLGGQPGKSPVLVISTDPQMSSVWWSRRAKELPFDFARADEDTRLLAAVKKSGKYEHILIDTPGSIRDERLLLAALEVADDVVVPLPTEGMAFDPTARTVDKLIIPMGLPYTIAINNWDPRDGRVDLDDTIEFVDRKHWHRAITVIRRYKVHTRAAVRGLVCTQYEPSRAASQGKEDFLKLAMELGYGARRPVPAHRVEVEVAAATSES